MQQELKFFAENRYTIERLRTENEIIAFFAKNNIPIDKNFTNKLKLKYKTNNSSILNSSQLEEVSGGAPPVGRSTRKSDYCLRNRRVPVNPNAQNIPNADRSISAPGSPIPPPTSPMSLVKPMPLTDETSEIIQPQAKRSRVVGDKDENLVPLLQPLAVKADAGNSVVSLNISQKDNERNFTFHQPTPSPSLPVETESPALGSYWGVTQLFFYEAQSNTPGVHAEEMNLSCEGTGFPEYTQLFFDGTVSFTPGISVEEISET